MDNGDIGSEPFFIDEYNIIEDYESAKEGYENMLKHPDMWTCQFSFISDSTDAPHLPETPEKLRLYKATLKHDNGTCRITTSATSEEEAIRKICIAEYCPQGAIKKIVRVKDKKPRTYRGIYAPANNTFLIPVRIESVNNEEEGV